MLQPPVQTPIGLNGDIVLSVGRVPSEVIAVVTMAWLAAGNAINNRTRLSRKVRRKVFPTESGRRNACSLWSILDSHQSYRSLLIDPRGVGRDNPPTTQ